MVSFPNIRAPLRSGWRGVSVARARSTPVDIGPAKRRGERFVAHSIESLEYKLNRTHAGLLDDFYGVSRALSFDFTHPIWGAVSAAFEAPLSWRDQGPWRYASVQLAITRQVAPLLDPEWPEAAALLERGWRGAGADGVLRSALSGVVTRRWESAAVGAADAHTVRLPDIAAVIAFDRFFATIEALRFPLDHPVWGAVQARFVGGLDWMAEGRFFYANVNLEVFRETAMPAPAPLSAWTFDSTMHDFSSTTHTFDEVL